MYSVTNNVAYINGNQGKYDNIVKDNDVRYGRNAADNYKSYISELSSDKMPPLEFEYRYMPEGKLNKFALLGNAYEELGQRTKVQTEELNKQMESIPDISADALDLNKDGYVDIAEYSTGTLVQDILSSDDGFNINPEKIDGIINNEGENKSFALMNKKNKDIAGKIYNSLYEVYDLGKAQEEFIANKNNLE